MFFFPYLGTHCCGTPQSLSGCTAKSIFKFVQLLLKFIFFLVTKPLYVCIPLPLRRQHLLRRSLNFQNLYIYAMFPTIFYDISVCLCIEIENKTCSYKKRDRFLTNFVTSKTFFLSQKLETINLWHQHSCLQYSLIIYNSYVIQILPSKLFFPWKVACEFPHTTSECHGLRKMSRNMNIKRDKQMILIG